MFKPAADTSASRHGGAASIASGVDRALGSLGLRMTAAILLTALTVVPAAGATAHAAPRSRSAAVPDWQKYEPLSYDTAPPSPGMEARTATPADTALGRLSGQADIAWWLLKNPRNPREFLGLIDAEPLWPALNVGSSGPMVWTFLRMPYTSAPQFPFLNGMFALKKGLPATPWPGVAVGDGKPGLRSSSLNINYDSVSNTWQVKGRSPLAEADFTADHIFPGDYYHIPVGGPNSGTEPTNVDAVINSELHGTVSLNGRTINVDGWRGEYSRLNMFPSIMNSVLNPATSWRGWEFDDILEPDGGASQFFGIINAQGRYSGMLIDARPERQRMCSKTTLKFGDYSYGRGLIPDITPPFRGYPIPGWVKVTCAPGSEEPGMSKVFYPQSHDYIPGGVLSIAEVPASTGPGSFGTYEHTRFATFTFANYLRSLGIIKK